MPFSTFTDLPIELVGMIGQQSEKQVLLNLRRTSRFVEKATFHTFRSLGFTEKRVCLAIRALKRLDKILADATFGPCVTTVIFLISGEEIFSKQWTPTLTSIFQKLASRGSKIRLGMRYTGSTRPGSQRQQKAAWHFNTLYLASRRAGMDCCPVIVESPFPGSEKRSLYPSDSALNVLQWLPKDYHIHIRFSNSDKATSEEAFVYDPAERHLSIHHATVFQSTALRSWLCSLWINRLTVQDSHLDTSVLQAILPFNIDSLEVINLHKVFLHHSNMFSGISASCWQLILPHMARVFALKCCTLRELWESTGTERIQGKPVRIFRLQPGRLEAQAPTDIGSELLKLSSTLSETILSEMPKEYYPMPRTSDEIADDDDDFII